MKQLHILQYFLTFYNTDNQVSVLYSVPEDDNFYLLPGFCLELVAQCIGLYPKKVKILMKHYLNK